MTPLAMVAYALLFPGVAFLMASAFAAEWIDRKLAARAQSRMGPPASQPFWDFVKLLAKEDITPAGASATLHALLPLLSFASVATAFLLLPLAGTSPFAFQGDLVLALFLLALPALLLFLAGWTSGNPFARQGALRGLAQTFAFDVPFFVACLGPGLAAGSWALADAAGWGVVLQPLGFLVALVSLQARLERVPFDAPHADTEIVAGPLIDISGRKLAFWRVSTDMGLVAGSALVATLFLGAGALPGLAPMPAALALLVLLAKTALLVLLLSGAAAALSRARADQLQRWGWRILAPLALVQIAFLLVVIS